jgi:O-antigen/teichoic acid export membrane protein
MLSPQLARLGKGTLIYGVGGLLNRFIGFLLLPLFTAYLTTTDYGVSSTLGLVSFIVWSVFSLGLNGGIGPCYFEGNDPKRKETVLWTTFVLLVVGAGVVAILGLSLAHPISSLVLFTPEYGYLVELSMFSTALGLLVMPFMLRLQFEERALPFIVLSAVSTLFSIGMNILLVVVLRRGVQGLVEGGLIGAAVNLVLFFVFTAPTLRFHISSAIGKELLRLSLPLMPLFVFQFFLLQSNKYILQSFKGLDQVGIYTVGFNLGMVMNLAVSAFQSAWYPYFMSFVDRPNETRVLFGRIMTYYVLGFGTVSLLFYFAAKPIVLIMTQPAFHEAYQIVGLSASAQFLLGIYYILLPGMYFAKEVKYQTPIQFASALLSVILNILLILTAGTFGAALGLALGALTLPILAYAWNLKRKRVYLDIQYEWRRIFEFVGLYLVCALVTLWGRNFSYVGEMLFSGALAIILCLVLYVLLRDSERRFLRQIVKYLSRRPDYHRLLREVK